MNDTVRVVLVIVGLIVIFVLSYIATDHLDNSYMLDDNVELERLQHENDSLKTVIADLQKEDEPKAEETDNE